VRVSVIVISKDEEKLSDTLSALAEHLRGEDIAARHEVEVVVVDASEGRLSRIAAEHPDVQWIDFPAFDDGRISIPHQRNTGVLKARGEIIVFTDAGCIPTAGWLLNLITPLVDGTEQVTCGPSWVDDNVYSRERGALVPCYVDEAPTINLAVRRELFDLVGDFDERFAYGSDVDFSWRLVAAGVKIRYVVDAVVVHDWGNFCRQLKRSRHYGAARIRLYVKHRDRLHTLIRNDPVSVLYALYLLGLPIALIRYRSYLALIAIPLWRARKRPFPAQVVACHLAEGLGGLTEMARMLRPR
jgi:glycosyltransferase involved in cell wall biosynthesis